MIPAIALSLALVIDTSIVCTYVTLSPWPPYLFTFLHYIDGSEETIAIAKSSLETVAKKFKDDHPNSELLFFYACVNEGQDVAASLIQFADLPKKTPLLAIIDIPNQKKYLSETVSITEDTVRNMIEVFQRGELEGNPLKP